MAFHTTFFFLLLNSSYISRARHFYNQCNKIFLILNEKHVTKIKYAVLKYANNNQELVKYRHIVRIIMNIQQLLKIRKKIMIVSHENLRSCDHPVHSLVDDFYETQHTVIMMM